MKLDLEPWSVGVAVSAKIENLDRIDVRSPMLGGVNTQSLNKKPAQRAETAL